MQDLLFILQNQISQLLVGRNQTIQTQLMQMQLHQFELEVQQCARNYKILIVHQPALQCYNDGYFEGSIKLQEEQQVHLTFNGLANSNNAIILVELIDELKIQFALLVYKIKLITMRKYLYLKCGYQNYL
ncbi:unnamed protein product [Paramecium sonneborni]|uniref:Uncharacterized protein n=1 Tax=Paramecium sonneborni TaxID=65129 RepID=A0A8S1RMX0_9CILI|nr:unnamed protein product [Paramecium sonneborni]